VLDGVGERGANVESLDSVRFELADGDVGIADGVRGQRVTGVSGFVNIFSGVVGKGSRLRDIGRDL
jgi:hypothetical protein